MEVRGASFQRGNLPFSQPFAQRLLTRDEARRIAIKVRRGWAASYAPQTGDAEDVTSLAMLPGYSSDVQVPFERIPHQAHRQLFPVFASQKGGREWWSWLLLPGLP
jgi:hypothetical protein